MLGLSNTLHRLFSWRTHHVLLFPYLTLWSSIFARNLMGCRCSICRFGTSERQWVEAQVENAKQQAILLSLKSQVTSDEAHIHLDLHSLR